MRPGAFGGALGGAVSGVVGGATGCGLVAGSFLFPLPILNISITPSLLEPERIPRARRRS
jgi:hypothetical protein